MPPLMLYHQLILNILNGKPSRNHVSSLTPEDWHSLFNEADLQGIRTLIYKKLESAGLDNFIPEEMRPSLRRQHLAVAARNAWHFHHLSELLKCFINEGVPAIGLKGVHLADAVYRDLGSRPMSDIDLLVRSEDLKKAVHCCYRKGYRFHHFNADCDPDTYLAYADRLLPQSKHYPRLTHPENRMSVELHIRISSRLDPFFIDMNGIWERAVPLVFKDMELYGLCPEDLILYLSLHAGYHHQFRFRLRGLYDVAASLRHYQNRLNWKTLQYRASDWRMKNCLWLTLFLCKALLGAEMPDEILDSPASASAEMVRKAEAAIFETEISVPTVPLFVRLKRKSGFRNKTIFFLQSIFPSREFMSLRYLLPLGSKRVYLYYPVRFLEYFLKWHGALWKTVSGNKRIKARMQQEERDLSLKEWMTPSP